MNDNFIKASRIGLRYETPHGMLQVEDLWLLPLTSSRGLSLDILAVELDAQLQTSPRKSFVNETTNEDDTTRLKFDIVLYILNEKKADAKKAEEAQANARKKQQLLSILEDKEMEQLKSMSADDIRKLVESL